MNEMSYLIHMHKGVMIHKIHSYKFCYIYRSIRVNT